MVRSLKSVTAITCFCLLVLCGFPASAALEAPMARSQGQLVYVPVYSHIFYGDRAQSFNLSVNLSIRNIDLHHPIEVTSVRYYDEKGKLLKEFVPQPLTVPPMAAIRFFIKESDVSGGSEASFLVRWQAAKRVHVPHISSLMVGVAFGQGISIATVGRVLEEASDKKAE